MGEYERCPTCGEWGWIKTHRCPPLWDVRLFGDEIRTRAVYDHDAEDAAAKYVEQNFAYLDYPKSVEIDLRRSGSADPWRRFEVEVVPVPEFTATEIEPAAAKP